MSQFAKQYRDFFENTEAGVQLLADLSTLERAEQLNASNTEDMQQSYAHTQRAKGVQQAIGKINSLMTEAKKPT